MVLHLYRSAAVEVTFAELAESEATVNSGYFKMSRLYEGCVSRRPRFCPSLQPLRPDFAERLLGLEIEVAASHRVEALAKLTESYSV